MSRIRTLVQVPPDVVKDIDALVGPRKRSAFLIELARREIKRQRLLRVFDDTEPIWKDEDHPELAQGADAWVRQMRAEAEARFQSVRSEPE